MASLMDMVGGRTKALDEQVGSFQARDSNQFYSEPDLREPLNAIVNDMKVLIEKNQYLEKTFKEIQEDVGKVGDIAQFLKRLDELDATVG